MTPLKIFQIRQLIREVISSNVHVAWPCTDRCPCSRDLVWSRRKNRDLVNPHLPNKWPVNALIHMKWTLQYETYLANSRVAFCP